MRSEIIKKAKRIVVKMGTTSVTHEDGRGLNLSFMENIASQVALLNERGIEVLLVSSGAVAAGVRELGLSIRPKELPLKQACAAIGQSKLVEAWGGTFAKKNLHVAQVLLTRDGLRDRARYLNARNTVFELLRHKAVPIINENDTVAVDEMRFSDNDMLAALLTNAVEADLLIILSDVDGVYSDNPRLNKNATRIDEIELITPEIEAMARGRGSEMSLGGMEGKFDAAMVVTGAGEGLVIADSQRENVLIDIMNAEPVGTFFAPTGPRLTGRRRWLAYAGSLDDGNKVTADSGAVNAICKNGCSLLPAGIIGVCGEFSSGDVISVSNDLGEVIARGITNCNSELVQNIVNANQSKGTKKIETLDYSTLIHRDNLVLLDNA